MEKEIHCTVCTPEVTVFDDQVEMGVLPAIDGEWMVMHNHAPSILLLGTGGLRLKIADQWRHYYVDSGIAQIKANNVSILCREAIEAKKLVPQELQQELQTLLRSGENQYSHKVMRLNAKLEVSKQVNPADSPAH